MDRRSFIRNSGLATGMLFVPSFLKAFEPGPLGSGNKRLVVIQLSGGNDGLNTIVPFTNDIYYKKRPGLSVPENKVIRLNDELGFNPAMQALKSVYDQGYMGILNNVGYPNPDRSHFRSLDIWHSASSAGDYLSTGWLGRYLDSDCGGCHPSYSAIEVDDTLSLAMKGSTHKALAIKDAKQLYNSTQEPFFKNIVAGTDPSMLSDDNLGYLYKTMIETSSSADYIYRTSKIYKNEFEYPKSDFAKQLKTISTFINSGLSTRVYYVSLSGFDTHVGQSGRQEKLLKTYSEAVAAFISDLKKNNNWNDTLLITFSEFGRRVEQNASGGTDHGTAGNVFVFSGRLKKQGILNSSADLSNLEEGDLKYRVDFRSVYANILDNWLEADSRSILGKTFEPLDFV
jgi:uncharacterized protein (DUF1501 family)